ncbi:hypothetical protein [Neorhizobium sp. LjRoot104]|uniref:hypothetical protein n=1 Tax=Neorhizobium sp. LjRoot104 TaxID=3342254 RepID=UPI003ECE6CEB
MTPSEQARLIDQQEFAAECLAIRQRAYALLTDRRARMREALEQWLDRPSAAVTPAPRRRKQRNEQRERLPRGVKPKLHEYGGVSLTREQWAEQLGITKAALTTRIYRLGSVEAAIAAGRMSTPSNTQVLRRLINGFRRIRNRQLIQRISAAFHSDTPGYIQTSHSAKDTGGRWHVHDLQPNLEKSR